MIAAVNDVNIGSCIRNDYALEPDKSYQVGRYASPHCYWGLGDRHILAYSREDIGMLRFLAIGSGNFFFFIATTDQQNRRKRPPS